MADSISMKYSISSLNIISVLSRDLSERSPAYITPYKHGKEIERIMFATILYLPTGRDVDTLINNDPVFADCVYITFRICIITFSWDPSQHLKLLISDKRFPTKELRNNCTVEVSTFCDLFIHHHD